MSLHLGRTVVNMVGLAAAAVVAITAGMHFQHASGAVPPPSTAARSTAPMSYLGLYEPTSPQSYSGVDRFTRLIGYRPNIAVYYSGWWEPFQLHFARAAREHRAIPMVQIEPRDVSLAAIASGEYNSYLRAYARVVRRFGHPVILSFGHEMNADWYGWGYRHTSPSVFIAAWRHIHNLFDATGTTNVIWLWTVNVVGGPQVSAVKAWWPGASYVTWIGVDGHYFQPHIKFVDLFGATLGQVRRLSRSPVLIAEAGIAPYVGISKIADLFSGAQSHGVIGVVWFDVQGHNMRVVNNPAAIAAFRAAASKYLKHTRGNRPDLASADHPPGLRP
jgi:mannan endo-1,4-beta-mannosidase